MTVTGALVFSQATRQRLRCVPGMFNRLEVQVLYPT
jgi:hypothetical protein